MKRPPPTFPTGYSLRVCTPELNSFQRPWFAVNGEEKRWQPRGEIMPEEESYGLLKVCDFFDLVWIEEGFSEKVRAALAKAVQRSVG